MIELTPLPYPPDALEPVVSLDAVQVHRALEERYVRRVNMILPNAAKRRISRGGELSIDAVIVWAMQQGDADLLFNAQQAMNHRMWWASLRPASGGPVALPVATRAALMRRFGTTDVAFTAGAQLAGRVFAQGWLWLVRTRSGHVDWRATVDSGQPTDCDVLLAIDLWEHAWLPDHAPLTAYGPSPKTQWARLVLERLANWDGVEAALTKRA